MYEKLMHYIKTKAGYSLHTAEDWFSVKYGNEVIFEAGSVADLYVLTHAPRGFDMGPNSLNKTMDNIIKYLDSNDCGKKYDSGKNRWDLMPKDALDYFFKRANDPMLQIQTALREDRWARVFYGCVAELSEYYDASIIKSLTAVCEIVTYGADKYGPNNWQQVERERYVAAFYRHFTAYINNEFVDKESNYHHLAHAACNAMFIDWKDTHE